MTLHSTPGWLQQGSHTAEDDRLRQQAIFGNTGVIGPESLLVSASTPAAMSVSVAAGWAAIIGTTQANMGVYVCFNDAATTVAIAAADATNPRIDLVCVVVNDAYYSGLINDVEFKVVTGTPAASPAVPATPANALVLAQVAVAAAATTIVAANITDKRAPVTVTPILKSPQEVWTVSATAATGAINFDALTQGVLLYTTAATANFTLNFRGDATHTLDSMLAIGSVITVAFLNTNGATAYYPTAFSIDGVAVTPKWAGGFAPTAGDASALDAYTFTIVKTAATPTYTVLASVVKYA